MPKKKQQKQLTVEHLRHAEYYGLQEDFDNLYAESKSGNIFTNLMDLILSRDNILLAYRSIKTNEGSNTPGTDKLTINDIGKLSADEVIEKIRFIVKGSRHGYRPKSVRRVDIPKESDPTKTRPLGIPCIWDRMVQQCIKQIMEPICEAKFSDNSFGFRPNRSAEHAISRTYHRLNISGLHYVIEFDIKSFFDEVNHSKLIKQIWAMGIHDKHLIWVIKQILKAPIKMPDGNMVFPTKGTPQGGLCSPLLANIVLNELDHWIESQWEENPVAHKYGRDRKGIGFDKSHGYRTMKKTSLKEMFVVRYADDFRIFCRTRDAAEKTKIAVTQWLSERLKLEVSKEKTKIVNVKRRYTDFLGFKIKVHPKGKTDRGKPKLVVKSHISNKNLEKMHKKLVEQAKRIAKPRNGVSEIDEISRYNKIVLGMQNYYRIATNVSIDCAKLNRSVMTVFTNRLKSNNKKDSRLAKKGRSLTKAEKKRYGKSKMMRYVKGSNEPIYPIGFVQHKNPIARKRETCSFTPEGREILHKNLEINTFLMYQMMKQSLLGRSAEYADNRISLFSAQWGKCAVTGREFKILEDIHCHHRIPKGKKGGTDKYRNLTLVLTPIHRLIHATKQDTINKYLNILNLTKPQIAKVNSLRKKAGVAEIEITTQVV